MSGLLDILCFLFCALDQYYLYSQENRPSSKFNKIFENYLDCGFNAYKDLCSALFSEYFQVKNSLDFGSCVINYSNSDN